MYVKIKHIMHQRVDNSNNMVICQFFPKLKKKNIFEETCLPRAGYKIIIFHIAVTIDYETLSKHIIEFGF
jgi:hypothetical protein